MIFLTALNAVSVRMFQASHTQHRAHHSQTRVCARLVGLSYAQLRERREFGRRGGFGEVACCVLSGDHVCGGLSGCADTVRVRGYLICGYLSRCPPAHRRRCGSILQMRPSAPVQVPSYLQKFVRFTALPASLVPACF
jgi:hypothetical protein